MIFSIEYMIILVMIGIFVGFSAGLLGIGGGFLMVPLQFFLLNSIGVDSDLALRISLGTSLAIIIPTALAGAYTHQMELKDIIKPGIMLGIFGIFGGVLGGLTSSYISTNILELILGIFLIIVAITMVFKSNKEIFNNKLSFNIDTGILFGVTIGFLSGLLGLGGGLFIIPVLVFILDFKMIDAIGISSIFISLTSLGGVVSYIYTGFGVNTLPYSIGYVSLINFGIIAIFSIPLAFLGAKLTHKISEKRLKQFFAILIAYMGIKILGLDPISYLLGF